MSLTLDSVEDLFRNSIRTAKDKGYTYAIDEVFDTIDINKTGALERCDILLLIRTAIKHVKLHSQVDESVIEAAVDALLYDAGATSEEQDFITREQFHDIFKRHPDMLNVFEDETAFSQRSMSVRQNFDALEEEPDVDQILAENEQTWVHDLYVRWENNKIFVVWIFIYIAANAAAFTVKAVRYARDEEAQAVFGSCIVVARGCAQCLNLNACLVLFFMCRHFMTMLRITRLRLVFPFDAIHDCHVGIGVIFGLLALSHTAAHICDFHRLGHADEDDIRALFGDKLNPPQSYSGRWAYMLGTRAGVTGIIMVVCIIGAYSFAFNRRNHFNRFWYTHHLLLVMLIALCIHGTGNLLEHYQSLYWIIPPLTLYILPRIWRETPLSKTDIDNVKIKPGKVVQLRLKKPEYYNRYVRSGMYSFVNVPEISRLEWHPFTLSSAPSDDYVEFHCRSVGDWTNRLHDLMQSKVDESVETGIINAPIVKIEGPIGASSQGFKDYSVIVLVAAGIGVTPMISVLRHLLSNPGKVRRCFFYWTVRDRYSFEWFTELIDDIFEKDKSNMLQIRHFLTSVNYDDRNLGAILLHHATRAHHKRTNIDLLLGQQIHHQVEVGRPNWEEELDSVREEAVSLGESNCGIFFCGPTVMADAVYEASIHVSKQQSEFFMYFTKETF